MHRKRWATIVVTIITGLSLIGSSVYATDAAATSESEKNGWEGNYYYVDGKPVKGMYSISGKPYYFDSKGVAQKKGFFDYKKKRYYSKGKGALATGRYNINGKPYLFDLHKGYARNKGFIKYKGKEYYCLGKGKLATGWRAIKNKKDKKNGYYFYKKTGVMAKKTVIGHLKIPKNGRLHQAYYYGIKTLNKKGWSLREAYKYSYKTRYQGRWYRVHKPKNLRSEKYALKGFKKRKGNCYVMAAEFYVMAKLLGYDIRQVYGRVGLPHSWTEIKHGSKVYVYDPNFRNETGRNGWKIWYGKKGTWRYHKSGNLNSFVRSK